MGNGQWCPAEWPELIRALADGRLAPVAARRAATVMLLRDTGDGPAVHMLRRRTSMAFAGGAYAYPGGGVDPRDDEHHVRWAGPTRAWWADRLGVDGTAEAQAIVCAAVRETYEEAGCPPRRAHPGHRGRRHHRRRLGGRPRRPGRP